MIIGVVKFQVEQDPTHRKVIVNLTPKLLQSPNNKKFMASSWVSQGNIVVLGIN